MHIKCFRAPDWSSALKQVREELGPDALVLSSREIRRRRKVLGWMAGTEIEIVAAIDRERTPARSAVANAGSIEQAARAVNERTEGVGPDPSWRGLAISRSLLDPIESEVRSLREAVESVRASRDDGDRLREELRALRGSIRSLVEMRAAETEEDGLALRLRTAGLAASHADTVAAEAGERRRRDGGDELEHARRVLGERLDAALAPPRPDDEAPVRLVVGAPGVGKTTTVAKWAGRCGAGSPVSLISAGAARLGADAPLRGFARKLEVPFHGIATSAALKRRIARCAGRQVWIDTPGLARRDPQALAELQELRAALGDRARTELVVSATTKEADLRAEIERHRALQPDALVVTRWDESDEVSNVVNLLLDSKSPPMSWLGTGQAVPGDLAVPEPAELAARLLGGVS